MRTAILTVCAFPKPMSRTDFDKWFDKAYPPPNEPDKCACGEHTEKYCLDHCVQ